MKSSGAVVTVVAVLLVACGDSRVGQPEPPPAGGPDPAVEQGGSFDVQPSPAPTQPGSSTEEVAARFIEAVSPTFRATRRAVDEPYPLVDDGPMPPRIEAWSFIAREPAPSEPGLRLGFALRVFEFGSADEASGALAGLARESAGSVLLKSPLLAVHAGSTVVRLDGACTFSRERWVEIQDALIRALPAESRTAASGVLEILCGGTVVRTPGSPPSGGGGRRDPADDHIEQ